MVLNQIVKWPVYWRPNLQACDARPTDAQSLDAHAEMTGGLSGKSGLSDDRDLAAVID